MVYDLKMFFKLTPVYLAMRLSPFKIPLFSIQTLNVYHMPIFSF